MHEFIEIDPKNIKNKWSTMKFARCCLKCKLIVGKINAAGLDYFFINEVEVFLLTDYYERLNLTCDEIMIKNILE